MTCDKSVVFSRYSTNRINRHDITEILLIVALNIINHLREKKGWGWQSRFCEEDLVTNEIRWFLCFLTWARNYSILFNNKKNPAHLFIYLHERIIFLYFHGDHAYFRLVRYIFLHTRNSTAYSNADFRNK